jgi:3-(3-hydroxy-phenyl)propionate hydroxylase
MVLEHRAPDALLDTYASEREYAADENIRNSTRSTDFITPKSAVSRVFRDAVLTLAREHAFARQLVNSGRLSVPAVLHESTLNTADEDRFSGQMVPGASCADAPLTDAQGNAQWLLKQLGGRFTGLLFCRAGEALDGETRAALDALASGAVPLNFVAVIEGEGAAPETLPAGTTVLRDAQGLAAQRYGAQDGAFYLIRPDQHVSARWHRVSAPRVERALKRALCVEGTA